MQSMTAFAREQQQNDQIQLNWEIKSVNSRYLELNFRLPDGFRELEPWLRSQLQTQLSRGKVDISLRYQLFDSQKSDMLSINRGLIERYLAEMQSLGLDSKNIDATALLKLPEVLSFEASDLSQHHTLAKNSFNAVIENLKAMRGNEGNRLAEMIRTRLADVEDVLSHVASALPDIKNNLKTKLENKLGELSEAAQSVSPERLEQELVMYAQRMDVDEELDRLHSHITEVRQLLDSGKPIGRRLDFLMQEFNREANTLGSKAAGISMTRGAVDLKVLIEQMREQVQNIE